MLSRCEHFRTYCRLKSGVLQYRSREALYGEFPTITKWFTLTCRWLGNQTQHLSTLLVLLVVRHYQQFVMYSINIAVISYLVVFLAVLNVRSSSAGLSGVHFDVPLRSLTSIGCSECVNSGLTGSLRKPSCSGAYIFYGVQSCSVDVFDLGAYTPAVEIDEQSLFTAPFIFGGADLHLHSCHSNVSNTTDLSELDSRSRDSNQDGGSSKEVVNNGVYKLFRNFVYTCPTGRFCFWICR